MIITYRDKNTKQIVDGFDLIVNTFGDVFEMLENENEDGNLEITVYKRKNIEACLKINNQYYIINGKRGLQ